MFNVNSASPRSPAVGFMAHSPGASIPKAAQQADRHFRALRAALNASEGGCIDRMFAGWRVRLEVHRLRAKLRQVGVHEAALPPVRRAFVQKQVPIAITDVAWHEQLRLWWWPEALSPDINA